MFSRSLEGTNMNLPDYCMFRALLAIWGSMKLQLKLFSFLEAASVCFVVVFTFSLLGTREIIAQTNLLVFESWRDLLI